MLPKHNLTNATDSAICFDRIHVSRMETLQMFLKHLFLCFNINP